METFDIMVKAFIVKQTGVSSKLSEEDDVSAFFTTRKELQITPEKVGETIHLLRSPKDLNYIKTGRTNLFRKVGKYRYFPISPFIVKLVKSYPEKIDEIYEKLLSDLESIDFEKLKEQLNYLFKGVNPYIKNSKVLNNWMEENQPLTDIKLIAMQIWTLKRKFNLAYKEMKGVKND